MSVYHALIDRGEGAGGGGGRPVFVFSLVGQHHTTVVRPPGAMKGLTPVLVILSLSARSSVSLKCWTTPFGEVGSMTDTTVSSVFVEFTNHLNKYFLDENNISGVLLPKRQILHEALVHGNPNNQELTSQKH